jgi:hypothetical protein
MPKNGTKITLFEKKKVPLDFIKNLILFYELSSPDLPMTHVRKIFNKNFEKMQIIFAGI